MQVFDGHYHIHIEEDSSVLKVDRRNVIFNSLEHYYKYKHKVKLIDSITLIFDFKSEKALKEVKKLHDNKEINALKIHSRIQEIDNESFQEMLQKLIVFNPKTPIIYDAFYYGHEIEFKPALENLIQLAKTFPSLPIIVAHSGGYEMLKYFFHLRQIKNIYYDLSLSLQLLSDSSVFLDLIKLVKFTDKSKILFGSDYPDAKPGLQFDILNDICTRLNLTQKNIHKIMYENSRQLYKPKGLIDLSEN
jgi:hypothetical protein